MLSIGNKKYRNLQEQVGYNTECIQELAEAIDGITLEDKLVIIANDSGTFSENEMTVLNGSLAFISDGSKVWLKQSETPTEFVFKAIDIVATEQGGTHYNVGGSKIVVTRATRAYVTSDDVIIVTYNKSQMDSLLALKADLSGANFSGPITAPSIIEDMSGYSFQLSTRPYTAYFTFDYAGVVKNGNKITFALAGELTPTAEWSGGLAENICSFGIPSAIGNKIKTINGEHCAYTKIQGFVSYTTSKDINVIFAKSAPTNVYFYFCPTSALTANQRLFFRYEITFLLGENLAQ